LEDSHQGQFKRERQQTDDSLFVERGKTDDSFETYKGRAEGKTDSVVKTGRRRADEARMERRDKADVERDLGDVNSSSPDQNEAQSECVIRAERKFEDREIESERSNMDSALSHERGEKERLMTKLLSQERGETDKSLLGERNKTDLEVVRSAGVLRVEQAAHSETRSALTTREELVAIVSHDLRNPIGAILSTSEILLEDESSVGLSDELKKWVEIIKRNAMTSLRLISDILDMERIVDGKIQLQLTKSRMDEILKQTVESYQHVAISNGVTLKVEPFSHREFVTCDRDRISQVLSNLIGNALKFTPKGGAVTVRGQETDNEIEVSVADTGPGIPAEQKGRIFERFAQLGNQDRSGIGLGLYISKTLVESHKGSLRVNSTLGKGSTFSFRIPNS
jgi:signal transduction histidine kinase